VHEKSTDELISLDSAIAQSEVFCSEMLGESDSDEGDFTVWLIFGVSPNLGLGDSVGERLIQKVK